MSDTNQPLSPTAVAIDPADWRSLFVEDVFTTEPKAQLLEGARALRREVTRLKTPESQHRRAEQVAQQGGHRLDMTLTSIGDAVIATDTDAVLTLMNPEAERLTGWPAQEALGRDVDEVLLLVNEETREVIASPIDRVLWEGVLMGLADHTVLIARDGREVPVAGSGVPIRDRDGALHGAVMVFREISQRERDAWAMCEARGAAEAANWAKSEVLSTVVHELRAPLSVIIGYTTLLQEGRLSLLPVEQTNILRRIDSNARELLDLISTVLDMSRLQVGRLPVNIKEVSIPNLIEEIKAETKEVCEQSGLQFVWEVDANLPSVRTDPGKLKVVVKNLLRNAVKFTKEGRVRVEASPRRGGVEIDVNDTGIGISQEALPLIFEPFYQVENSPTSQSGGTGLGLHIVKRLLELLGGTITVESEVGRGSTFCVWVPTGG